MFLVRSIVLAQQGRRDEVVAVLKEFMAEVPELRGPNARILTGSIGPSDATVVIESEHETLAEFEKGLENANKSEKMAKYGPKFAELAVPGSHRFEIFRICD